MFYMLLFLSALSDASPGIPVTVDYSVPEGYLYQELQSCEMFTVLESDSGIFEIVPLSFADTLQLPVLTAWNDTGDTLMLNPPHIAVSGWFPDSLMAPSLPPFPGYMNIPPGLPEDYARNMSFWLVWGAPPGFPWLPVIAGVVIVAAAVLILLKRKHKAQDEELRPKVHIPRGKAAEKEALDLLETENFIHGHWAELYAEVDSQYRTTVAGRFGIANRALTLGQISRALASTSDGRKFLEKSAPLVRETTLQRFADWGSSRERAAGFIRKLAEIRREWSR